MTVPSLEEVDELIDLSLLTSPRHAVARCRWCGSEFVWIYPRRPQQDDKVTYGCVQTPGHWVCRTPECARRQLAHAMEDKRPEAHRDPSSSPYIYVPTPAGTELEESKTKNVCIGGAAGGTKSHGLRWHAYHWSREIPGYTVLLLRNTFTQLENSHLLKMDVDQDFLKGEAVYVSGRRSMEFKNGSKIIAGHCQNPKDVENYLSSEWDEILIDEASQLTRNVIVRASTRARSDAMRPQVRDRGGAWVRLATNPGGPGALCIEEFYITRKPNPRRHKKYHPEHYEFIAAQIEDNPYLEEDYAETRLDPLDPERYEQLRHGKWGSFSGQFFSRFSTDLHVQRVNV